MPYKDPEKEKARRAADYQKNKAKRDAAVKKWREENKERVAAVDKARSAKNYMARKPINTFQ